MSLNVSRNQPGLFGASSADRWPQQILTWLPLSLFFPVGLMYAGVLLFYAALLAAGDWRAKWQRLKQHPLLWPILSLTAVSSISALLQHSELVTSDEFWSGFGHYQTYLLLLPFLTLEAGAWQRRALHVFFAGAVLAASLFVANFFHLLPDNTLFRSYVHYLGNKSILLGILLALAAGWMLHELRLRSDHRWLRLLALVYVIAALVLLSKTRTASLLFLAMAALMILRNVRCSWRSLALPLALVLALGAATEYALRMPPPATCIINDAQVAPWDVVRIRAVCSVQQLRDFSAGRKVGEDGMRLEIYRITAGMIAQQPWSGYGIAAWMPQYRQRAIGLSSATMSTPHNDYLLYLSELGVFGLLALLAIWISQLALAWRMARSALPAQREQAMLLAMLSVAMMLGAMFNAILRDGVFAMACMILLALPLAGVRRS